MTGQPLLCKDKPTSTITVPVTLVTSRVTSLSLLETGESCLVVWSCALLFISMTGRNGGAMGQAHQGLDEVSLAYRT